MMPATTNGHAAEALTVHPPAPLAEADVIAPAAWHRMARMAAADVLDVTEGPAAWTRAGRIIRAAANGEALGRDAVAALVFLCDDLLTVAGGLADNPAPYGIARAAVGALPGGADDHGAPFLGDLYAIDRAAREGGPMMALDRAAAGR